MNTKPTQNEVEALIFTIQLLAELVEVSPDPKKKSKLIKARDTLADLRNKCIVIRCQGTLGFTSAN